jgi:hypothetical protein
MSKSTKEDNDASLLAMENPMFGSLMDAMQDQSQAMYAFVDRHVHHLSNSFDNAQPLHNSITYYINIPLRLNEPTIQETPDGEKPAVPLLIRADQLSKRLQMTPYQLSKRPQMAMKSAPPLLISIHYLSKRLQTAMK